MIVRLLWYANPGDTVILSASGSYDPDNDDLEYFWSLYEEPSDYEGNYLNIFI